MNQIKKLAWGLIALASVGSFFFFSNTYSDRLEDKEVVVTIKPKSYKKAVQYLQENGYDIAGIDHQKRTIDIVVRWTDQTKSLLSNEFNISHVEPVRMKIPDGYLEHHEIEKMLQDYATQYSDIALLKSIGKSLEGRDIWAMKISDNVKKREEKEPVILFNGMHHAREIMTPEVPMDTIEYLLSNYSRDEKVTSWVNQNEIWVVPMVNPDGNHRVWNGQSMWRKNGRPPRGVDLNRNYPFRWGGYCNGSSGDQFSETYRGTGPASEPETQALMKLVEEVRPVFNISYHSYSELVLYPYSCRQDGTDMMSKKLGDHIASLLPRDSGSGTYTPGTPWDILYSVDGDDSSWMLNEFQVLAFVIELNQDFHPSYSLRDPTVKKLRSAWQYLLDRAGESGIRGIVRGLDRSELKNTVVQLVQEKNGRPKVMQSYRVNRNGVFHFVVNPGTYSIRIKGQRQFGEKEVRVGKKRVNISISR